MVTFIVEGTPVQQGSKSLGKRNDGSAFMRESAKGLKAWRKKVADGAAEALRLSGREAAYDGALELRVTFYFPPIKSGRVFKTSSPDLDKLVRAIGDSLKQGGLIVDDARIVVLTARKLHAASIAGVGAVVTIHQVEEF